MEKRFNNVYITLENGKQTSFCSCIVKKLPFLETLEELQLSSNYKQLVLPDDELNIQLSPQCNGYSFKNIKKWSRDY